MRVKDYEVIYNETISNPTIDNVLLGCIEYDPDNGIQVTAFAYAGPDA